MNKHLSLLAAALLCTLTAGAKVTLPPMFTDNMVIQQLTSAPVWGKATPGATVTVTPSWNRRKAVSATAGPDGRWSLHLDTPKAGGPYTLDITDGEAVRLANVMVGEVWLCTGQSNMEMPLEGWGKIKDYKQEIAAADHPRIRLLTISRNISTQPLDDATAVGGGWQVCSPQTVPEFSACAYFFGRDLEKYRGVAIGLIEDCWGGSYAENWTSREALADMDYFHSQLADIASLPLTAEEQRALYEQRDKAWAKAIEDADPGLRDGHAAWAAGSDLKGWTDISVPGYVQQNGLPGFNGIVWLRTTVSVPKEWAGKDLTLNLGPVDDNDITYVNGIEVGRTEGWMAPRSYTVPAALVKDGTATVAVRVTDTGAGGGMYGSPDGINLTGPDGRKVALAGKWSCRVGADLRDFPPRPVNYANNPFAPTVLYNAMLRPVIPYAIRGAIWYQGESNANLAFQYRDLLPLMIRDWRSRWGKPFDFYIVQLANYMKKQTEPCESSWAELREAQQLATRLEHTGLATAIDIGMADDIHPKNKQEIGRRLALAARARTYGERIEYSGPQYEGCTVEGRRVRLTFSHTAGGLKTADGTAPAGFAIAGSDHKFRWAKATIEGNSVVVEADGVRNPAAVRYAWADNPVCNMYNSAGLPMLPFRTDDWKLSTDR